MEMPERLPGTRICVLLHPDEVLVLANAEGFKSLAQWMLWLAESKPSEFYHLHLLWHLESEECKFQGKQPKNIWVLNTPPDHIFHNEPPPGTEAVPNELTFMMAPEEELDELAAAQATGEIPVNRRKSGRSYQVDC